MLCILSQDTQQAREKRGSSQSKRASLKTGISLDCCEVHLVLSVLIGEQSINCGLSLCVCVCVCVCARSH